MNFPDLIEDVKPVERVSLSEIFDGYRVTAVSRNRYDGKTKLCFNVNGKAFWKECKTGTMVTVITSRDPKFLPFFSAMVRR